MTKGICSGLRATIITTAIQKSIQRKQRNTIITHTNIKKEVDSQLNPYVKKGCTWVCSSVPATVKVLLKLMLCKSSHLIFKKTAEKTAKGGGKNFSLTTFGYEDWNEVKQEKFPYFTMRKRYSDDQM